MIHQKFLTSLLLGAAVAVPCLADEPLITRNEATSEANQPTPDANYETARDLLKRQSVDGDTKKGFNPMLQSAEGGYLPAMAGVAYLYNVGMGVEKDDSKAAEWYRKAAEKNHSISQFNLGRLLISDEVPLPSGATDRTSQHREGIEWIHKAADAKLTAAQAEWGVILLRGDFDTKPDAAEAERYLAPAADAGNPDAMNALGTMYQFGKGVLKDRTVAERYFRKAAMAGNVKAQANLGDFLDPSSKIPELRIEAVAWLFLAEEAKNTFAIKVLQNKLPAISQEDIAAARKKADELSAQIVRTQQK